MKSKKVFFLFKSFPFSYHSYPFSLPPLTWAIAYIIPLSTRLSLLVEKLLGIDIP